MKLFVQWINDVNPTSEEIVEKVINNSKACCGAIALHNTLHGLSYIKNPEADVYVTLNNIFCRIKYFTKRDICSYTDIEDVHTTLVLFRNQ